MMKRIMFVCHGNICRSPMAQFVFLDIVKKNGEESDFFIDSSATSYEEIGNPLYPTARRMLDREGIKYYLTQAKKLMKSDYDSFDLFICMDEKNIRMMRSIFGADERNKIHKLLDFTENTRDVSDPYYTGDFDATFCDIKIGCEALYRYLKSEKCK